MVIKKKKNVSCGGTIVFRMNESGNIEFLLTKHSRDKDNVWGCAKGHQEANESIEETAVRETYEETGIVSRLLYEMAPAFTSNPRENKSVHIFLAKPLNPEAKIKIAENDGIESAEWFDIDNLPEIYEYQKPIIEHAKNLILKNMKEK